MTDSIWEPCSAPPQRGGGPMGWSLASGVPVIGALNLLQCEGECAASHLLLCLISLFLTPEQKQGKRSSRNLRGSIFAGNFLASKEQA
ncbi:hypothetical protein SKAU_G00201150 [Synaphobranchus kaupii]|uniref:Uncharacterized protein n=1 Tax=Synaphobranchus kaupii TaxID=118154 RepID=A0A9Q1FFK9_SYNKA|nr:hypothetical protein SKAU_G00201150 [Synaphobranchus kaupii]